MWSIFDFDVVWKLCHADSHAARDDNPTADPEVAEINNPTNATFKIKDKILCTSSYFINWKW